MDQGLTPSVSSTILTLLTYMYIFFANNVIQHCSLQSVKGISVILGQKRQIVHYTGGEFLLQLKGRRLFLTKGREL